MTAETPVLALAGLSPVGGRIDKRHRMHRNGFTVRMACETIAGMFPAAQVAAVAGFAILQFGLGLGPMGKHISLPVNLSGLGGLAV